MACTYIRLKKNKNNSVAYRDGYFGWSIWSIVSPFLVALYRRNLSVVASLFIVYNLYMLVFANFFRDLNLPIINDLGISLIALQVIVLNLIFVFCYNKFEISVLEISGYTVCSEDEFKTQNACRMDLDDEELRDILKKRR